jgi:hypothetical protein
MGLEEEHGWVVRMIQAEDSTTVLCEAGRKGQR